MVTVYIEYTEVSPYLEHLHVRPELLDERLDDGLGRRRRGHADALGRHLLTRVVLVLRLQRMVIIAHSYGFKCQRVD